MTNKTNPASREKQEAFQGQIEKSLDQQIRELEIQDVEQAKILKDLKAVILAEIKTGGNNPKTEGKEGYLDDLSLTSAELDQVFYTLKDQLAKNGIKDINEFCILIGLPRRVDTGTYFAEELQNVELNGQRVDFRLPFGASKQVIENAKSALEQIKQRSDILTHIKAPLIITPFGGARFEFFVEIDGERKKYAASPEDVLWVKKEPSQEVWKKRIKIVKKAKKECSRIIAEITKTYPLDPKNKSELERGLYHADKMDIESISAFYRPYYKEMAPIMSEFREIDRAAVRILVDAKGKEVIEREYFTVFRDIFEREYEGGNRKIKYEGNILVEKKVKTDSGFEVTRFYPGDKHLLDKLAPNGELQSREFFGKKEEWGWRWRKKDGSVMLTDTGKELGDFHYENRGDKEVLEDDYFGRFIQYVSGSTDRFFNFEEIFFGTEEAIKKFPESLYNRIRQHGKEITGVSAMEERLERRYGIIIETENLIPETRVISAKRFSVRALKPKLEELNEQLAKYPLSFIKNSGLRELYIFNSYKSYYGVPVGGQYSWDGMVLLGNDIVGSFDHELFHCADDADGESFEEDFVMGNENSAWKLVAHGEKYEHVKDKDRVATIKNGLKKFSRPEGFASRYGKLGGIEEDQATIAEFMFRRYKDMMIWAQKEPALAVKIELTKAFYYRLSGGKMDEQYWQDIANGKKINDKYWEQKKSSPPKFSEKVQRYENLVRAERMAKSGDFTLAEELLKKPEELTTGFFFRISQRYRDRNQEDKAIDEFFHLKRNT